MWEDSYGENKQAGTAHHKPSEPCKSQFTVQTHSNSCYGRRKKKKEACDMASVQWLIVARKGENLQKKKSSFILMSPI